MACTYPLRLTTANHQTHVLQLRIADTFATRLAGLLLTRRLQHGEGLILTGCNSVHTIGMRLTIDVVYLDRSGHVVKCVPELAPYRASWCKGAATTVELAQGSIARFNIGLGDHVELPVSRQRSAVPPASSAAALATTTPPALPATPAASAPRRQKQAGAAMMEFIVVGPVLTLIGLATLQYSLLFFAKNNYNHAAFMAARAGSTGHADLGIVRDAYAKALIPQYGGGANPADIQAALDKARIDVAANATIALLNPTKESFDDYPGGDLVNTVGQGRRVIPNANLGLKAQTIGAASGQTIGDANLIKLRITHGYEPKVPLVGNVMLFMLKWYDDGKDSIKTGLYQKPRASGGVGYIPVISDVTLRMQSDAIEPNNPVSLPEAGNNGNPQAPGASVTPKDPPKCLNISCSVLDTHPSAGCNPATDANQCRAPGCQQGDKTCDPGCRAGYCCTP